MSEELPGTRLRNIKNDPLSNEECIGRTKNVEVHARVFEEGVHKFSEYDRNFDRILLCVNGAFELTVEGNTIEMKEGDLYKVPAETSHGARNPEPDTRILILRGTTSKQQ